MECKLLTYMQISLLKLNCSKPNNLCYIKKQSTIITSLLCMNKILILWLITSLSVSPISNIINIYGLFIFTMITSVNLPSNIDLRA